MPHNLDNEIRRLRRRLAGYLARVRENEGKLKRLHEQELRLVSAHGLVQVLTVILHDLRRSAQLSAVYLLIADEGHELRFLLQELQLAIQFPELQVFDDLAAINDIIPRLKQIWLGRYDHARHAQLLPQGSTHPSSIALLPLLREEDYMGCLCLASNDPSRYQSSSATDFLERLGVFVAAAWENALNHERIKRLGFVDPLTQVYNRRYFDERVTEELLRQQRHRKPLSCLYLDVDHFKKINDQYGHEAGDIVLKEVAHRIRHQLRSSDVLARYGGEEFVALLAQTQAPVAFEIAERVRYAVSEHRVTVGKRDFIRVTLSIGSATLNNTDGIVDCTVLLARLIRAADHGLYRAKAEGRDRVVSATVGGTAASTGKQ